MANSTKEIQTTCAYCGAGCQLMFTVDQSANKILDVRPVAGRTNEGKACLKGWYGWDYLNDPQIISKRLREPMMRKNGRNSPLEVVTWDEAISYTAKRLMEIKEKYLTINPWSRPGKSLSAVKGIVIHWVANPKTTAENNRSYFENLKNQNKPSLKDPLRFASAHFIIGLEGEVIQCLLENEVGYHVGADKYTERALRELSSYPNNCTIGIELCHPTWDGDFTEATLGAAKELILELCERHRLGRGNVYRHFDITGKDCPRYFVKHGDEWEKFLNSIFPEVNSADPL